MDTSQPTKHCPRCDSTLPLESFSKRTASPDGRQGYCRACMKAHTARAAGTNGKYQKLTPAQWAEKRAACNSCGTRLEAGTNWRACDQRHGHFKCTDCARQQARDKAAKASARLQPLRDFKRTLQALAGAATASARAAERAHRGRVSARHAAASAARQPHTEAAERHRRTHCRECARPLTAETFASHRRKRSDFICNECHHVSKLASDHEQRAREHGTPISAEDRPTIRSMIRAIVRLNGTGARLGLPVLGLDHVVPLGAPGSAHAVDNLMVLPNGLNGTKGTSPAAEVEHEGYRKWLAMPEEERLSPWLKAHAAR